MPVVVGGLHGFHVTETDDPLEEIGNLRRKHEDQTVLEVWGLGLRLDWKFDYRELISLESS